MSTHYIVITQQLDLHLTWWKKKIA